MTTRRGPITRARRIAAEDHQRVIAELVRSREAAGLSRADVGRPCGFSKSSVERAERGTRRTTHEELACLGAVVGLDVRMRAYPAGDAIRDAGQARLLERLRRKLHPDLRWRTEVPLPIEGDLRAWDAVISGQGWRLPVEAETVLTDVQAVERKLELKRRDGEVDHLLLLLSETPRNRRAVRTARAAFARLDTPPRDLLRALRAGRKPPGGGIVFL